MNNNTNDYLVYLEHTNKFTIIPVNVDEDVESYIREHVGKGLDFEFMPLMDGHNITNTITVETIKQPTQVELFLEHVQKTIADYLDTMQDEKSFDVTNCDLTLSHYGMSITIPLSSADNYDNLESYLNEQIIIDKENQ